MKITIRKSILFASIFLVPLLVRSQISITMSDMPSVNDTIRYSVVQSATGTDFKSTGADKVWDFKNLKSNSQALYEYKASGSTPYILNFGFSAIGLKIADSLGSGQAGLKQVYNFYKKTSAKWENVGIGFQLSALPLPQAGKHTNPDEVYQFPLNYTDHDSSSFALKIPLTAVIVNIGNYFRDGNRINTVDGWGKISTPYQSDVACIRIKSVITETDSMALAITGQTPINFAFPNNRVEYKWLSNTEKIPMLEVSGTEIGGVFTPTTIRYRDKYISNFNPLAPVVDFSADKLFANLNDIITLTDQSTNTPNTFNWTITPATFKYENSTTKNSQNPQVSFSATGTYTVKLVASNTFGNGAATKTNYLSIHDYSAVKELTSNSLLTYPNPAKDILNIELNEQSNQSVKVLIFDMSGKNIENIQFAVDNKSLKINTSKLSNGQYNLLLITEKAIYHTPVTILK